MPNDRFWEALLVLLLLGVALLACACLVRWGLV